MPICHTVFIVKRSQLTTTLLHPLSDYGLVTILYADPVPGLQIFTSGAWHNVTPLPGSLIVNFGDMTALVTNDRYLSTSVPSLPLSLTSNPLAHLSNKSPNPVSTA